MSPNRIVAFLTPLVFAPLAGTITAWSAENLPGVTISQNALEEIFIAGALIALAPALQWLHGWQKYEAREQEALMAAATGFAPPGVTAVAVAEAEAEPLDSGELDVDDSDALDGIDDLDALDDIDDLDALVDLDDLEDFDEFEDTAVLDEERPVPAGS